MCMLVLPHRGEQAIVMNGRAVLHHLYARERIVIGISIGIQEAMEISTGVPIAIRLKIQTGIFRIVV